MSRLKRLHEKMVIWKDPRDFFPMIFSDKEMISHKFLEVVDCHEERSRSGRLPRTCAELSVRPTI